jgi:hypothetical protein
VATPLDGRELLEAALQARQANVIVAKIRLVDLKDQRQREFVALGV